MDPISTIEAYLGFPEGADPATRHTIEKTYQEMKTLLKGRCVHETFKVAAVREKIVDLSHPLLSLKGGSITAHLAGCEEVVLMACTLGQAADRLIQLRSRLSPYEGLIHDAAASVMIEEVCDDCEAIIKQAYPATAHFPFRFSPGYGDMPLSDQINILQVLDAYKKIGLSLNESSLLVPLKSIVAVLGIASRPLEARAPNRCGEDSCQACPYYESCHFRK
jgi:5-methyltetrahydrofolate--homocysteine methyltransferase